MRTVLQFPQGRSKRVRALMKSDAQRLFLSMSLMSLILVAVFANEQMVSNQRPIYLVSDNTNGAAQLNRAIASAQPIQAFRDVEWEHSLAQRLGNKASDRNPASISQHVTMMDDLKYGPLAGKYLIRTLASQDLAKVNEIEYVDSNEITDSPIRLRDSKTFLMKYRGLMSVPYVNAELAYQSEGQEVWQLVDQQSQLVGRAKLSFDSHGNFLSMKFEKL